MPIIGLTNNAPSFPRIGELRKGGAKTDSKRPGPDLNYFRFTSNLPEVSKKFTNVYGNQPQSVNVLLPYDTTDENFEAWQEEWAAGGLVHRCDGQNVVMQREGAGYATLNQAEPCPYASGQKQRTKQDPGCKQVGRLKVIIPELGRLAYVVALTTSLWDISEINGNLKAYEALRGSLRGIPFVFSRVPRMISTPTPDGGRARREKWLWHIEADAAWVQAQLGAMQRHALPSGARLALSSGAIVDSDTGEIVEPEDIEEGEIVTTETPTVQLAEPKRLKALHAAGTALYGKRWDTQRAVLANKVSKGRTNSSKKLSATEVETLITGIKDKADSERAPAPTLFNKMVEGGNAYTEE